MEQKDLNHYARELGLKKVAEDAAFKTLEVSKAAADDARDARIRAEEELDMATARVKDGLPADLDVNPTDDAAEIEAILNDDEPFEGIAAEAEAQHSNPFLSNFTDA
ncbi:MAG: hypothetical protein CL583_13365 [Alteromonadaceae bacterium]|nr:hypothetical protein [Alteromonadaceae bacterium]|tara:strand:+ start:944 stop:1264 length:321 start_codon:yes stop_codon:yes gene_type:complete